MFSPGIYKHGLAGLYKFIEPADSQTLIDYSRFGRNGLNGGTVETTDNDAVFDGAKATFTTDKYIKIPYFDGFAVPYALQIVFALGDVANETGFLLGVQSGVASLRFNTTYDSLSCGPTANRLGLAKSNFANGVFSDVCVSYLDASTIKCFHNGVDKTIALGGFAGNDSGALQVGARAGINFISSMQVAYLLVYKGVMITSAIAKQNHLALRTELAKRGIALPLN